MPIKILEHVKAQELPKSWKKELNPSPEETFRITIEPESELTDEPFDVTHDPIFQLEGYDSDAPSDLSKISDKLLYGKNHPA